MLKKKIREAAGPDVRHRTGDQPIERREDDIHCEIEREQGREELRPGQCNGEMVRIAHIETRNPDLLEFV